MKTFKSVLIIDNDTVSNYMTRNFFAKIQCCEEIHFCKNGKEALRFIDLHFLPELILLDLFTPVMDGFEFIENLNQRGLRDKTNLILYTSQNQEHLNHSDYHVIDKPLTMEKFCNVTETMV